MEFTERYDTLIAKIEEAVQRNEREIPEKLARASGIHVRVIADAFQFISGITLAQYIKQRRMLYAVRYKNKVNCSLEEAAEEFGFSDAPTLSKAFKNCFGVSPTQMTEDMISEQMPLTSEKLLLNMNTSRLQEDEGSNSAANILGIDHKHFESIKEAIDKSSVYGLSDAEIAFAYELSLKREIPLSEALELIEEFSNQEQCLMCSDQFMAFAARMQEYLETEKRFIENPLRMAEVQVAAEILDELFPNCRKTIEGDPLQMGAIILRVEDFDIIVRGKEELALFSEFCSLVDNFEIYSHMEEETVYLSAVMQRVYTRVVL